MNYADVNTAIYKATGELLDDEDFRPEFKRLELGDKLGDVLNALYWESTGGSRSEALLLELGSFNDYAGVDAGDAQACAEAMRAALRERKVGGS